ncbi:MAG: glycosyltransferase family 4 protein [Armatimonadota bacterium]
MKIRLVLIATSPLFLGFLRGFVRTLKERGFDVYIICSPGELLHQFMHTEQVTGYGVQMPRRITPWQDLLALVRLCLLLRRIRPHIVHAHTPKGGLLGTISATICRVPIRIYHIRGLPHLSATGFKRALLRWSERIACALAHQVLCVSHSIRQVVIDERICPAHKIKVPASGSGQGVDAERRFNPARFTEEEKTALREQIGIPEDALVIGYVGRLVRDKGITELAQAWNVLRAKYHNLHLLLVGDYEPQDPVPHEIKEQFHSDPRVHLTGWVNDASVYYPLMHLLVLPSYREGFPNTPLEASAMCLPVVATRIPGCVDAVVDGVTGTLVPPRDAEALREAIERYILQPDLRIQHGTAGRQRVLAEFRPEVIWRALYEQYHLLMEQRGVTGE